jgi:transposase
MTKTTYFLYRSQTKHAKIVIPPTSPRKEPREFDRQRYRYRNVIEIFSARVKLFLRIATRDDKLA